MSRLAVVMATFDGARFLPEQLASIAAQTRRPDVLVVSDDGSSDDTVEVLRRFAATAPFEVRILDGPGTGVADNFLGAATRTPDADLVAWCDQDDVWHPAKLERCESALARSGALLASHSAQVVDETLRPRPGHRCPDHRRDAVLAALEGDPWHVPSGFATVFRRALLDDVDWTQRPASHMTSRSIIHDHAVALRAYATGGRVQIAAPLGWYRQHGGNVHGDPTPHGLSSLVAALDVGAVEFRRLADRARGYGAFLSGMPGASPATAPHFERTAQRCEQRASVYEAAGRARRARRLPSAMRRGVYRRRASGGFGTLALAKDVTSIALGAGPAEAARPSRRTRGGPLPPRA